MSTLFQNVAQSQQYAAFRPTYPPAVYRRIIQALENTQQQGQGGLGVDVGCGSGQATLGLARVVAAAAAAADINATSTTNTFASAIYNANMKPPSSQPVLERVIGIDPSPAQIQQARHKLETNDTTTCSRPTVEFHIGNDTEIVKLIEGLHHAPHPHNNPAVTCITAAQAAHWFDLPMFYQQVDQLLVSGGVLALWTYGNLRLGSSGKVGSTDNNITSVAAAVQELEHKIMVELYEHILGDTYWDPRRRHAETMYRELPQIQTVLSSTSSNTYTTEYITNSGDVDNPDFSIRQTMTRPQLMGYLRSWSGYISYLQHNQISPGSTDDPVAEIDTWIANRQRAATTTTGTTPALPGTFQVEWPIAMLLSIKQ